VTELAFRPATEQAHLIRRRQLSPVEAVTTYLERIEKFDPTLNAYVTVVGEQALEQARRAEEAVGRGGDLPPFLGVPIAIKDLTETAGIRTTFGSKAYSDYVPDIDAASVRRIKEAGFIILGKTNAPEFGTFPQTESEQNGIARNPWNTDHTPGGSSGGAGAALAAGLCPVAHGSDGGGSIRIPSSYCGLFGLKPARGRISSGPRFGEGWNGMSTQGPITRTVTDAAALLDVMAGYETGDPYWAPPPPRPFADEVGADPGPLRIAFITEAPTGVPTEPEVEGAVKDAASLLESLGHSVEEGAPDWVDPSITANFVAVLQAGFSHHIGVDFDLFEPANRLAAEQATQVTSLDYVSAVTGLHAFTRRVVAFWSDYDLLLTPTVPMTPPPVGWIFEEEDPFGQLARAGLVVPFTAPANITGQPAASLPLAWSESGLPIGVQLIGRPADEATLLRVSAQIEEARPWADRRPPIS
jgi:amidase